MSFLDWIFPAKPFRRPMSEPGPWSGQEVFSSRSVATTACRWRFVAKRQLLLGTFRRSRRLAVGAWGQNLP